ncbi:IS630 family transposase [Deinococcus sp. HMF7604]|uniref:IS630 family transposase n=1 Tax=Deinococcus betulae TaxID=2873312 RepID=UPI001CCBAD6C|nr:IS630 family transposase [Deinococcus betulae]MBZ9753587.1 IS630 family transposase [Deinococcus betulae]
MADVAPWRPRQLSRAQQEERRLSALPLLVDTQRTTRSLAEQFGVKEVTIRAWRAQIRRGGEEALRASRATGRPQQLTAGQQAEIQGLLDRDPRTQGFDTSGWTTARVRELIGRRFGVWMHRDYLSRKLHQWGFSYQRPAVRAVERNEEEVATWVRLQGEALEKKIAEGATVVFLDESGFSLKTTKVRTWGRCGQTPVIPTRLRWEHLSVIGAITTGGQFLQHTHHGAIRSPQVVAFLEHVLRHIAGEVVVVLDRAMIHRAKVVQACVARHARLSLVYLPGDAPELNPIELVWADVKRNVLGNFCAPTVSALKVRLVLGWQRIRRKDLARAFIRGTPFTTSLLT